MMQRLIHILWPSFLVAGAADIIFTSLFDPLEILYRGEPLIEHRIAAYTIGFFFFCLFCIVSSSAVPTKSTVAPCRRATGPKAAPSATTAAAVADAYRALMASRS